VQNRHPAGHRQAVGGQIFQCIDVPEDGAFFGNIVHTTALSCFTGIENQVPMDFKILLQCNMK
jgi:hypothetical protein